MSSMLEAMCNLCKVHTKFKWWQIYTALIGAYTRVYTGSVTLETRTGTHINIRSGHNKYKVPVVCELVIMLCFQSYYFQCFHTDSGLDFMDLGSVQKYQCFPLLRSNLITPPPRFMRQDLISRKHWHFWMAPYKDIFLKLENASSCTWLIISWTTYLLTLNLLFWSVTSSWCHRWLMSPERCQGNIQHRRIHNNTCNIVSPCAGVCQNIKIPNLLNIWQAKFSKKH